ncbi:hypothetical protein BE221DRAFT_173579 [Ostreococcus tauri]|uniref:DNA-directed RNA polymerase subunit beta n=1 Tax=Ostreococcus tauri TaxID=70448 RepID=A0A1Y5I4D2_OSTTA|nr:hypothetical protein BE221DRAFT_173579 [Ostreococcus tauri]
MTLFRQNSALPNFLDSQRDSFRYFLETGIREELDFFSPIVGQSLGSSSKRPTDQAVQKLGTYKSSLIVPVHVYSKYLNLNATFPVAFCDLPLMTEHGTFILNGSPRVIVHQIVRCPGVYLKPQFDKQGNRTHLVSFLSAYGSWLRFETDKKGVVFAHIDNLRKVPVTVFLQALGFSMDTIVGALKYPEALDPTLKEVDWKLTTDEAILLLMSRLFPNRPATVLRGRKFLFNQFFNPRRYSLSDVGRKRVNQKFRMRSKTKHLTLTPQDALAALDYLLRCENGETEFLDDIDHLKNRRARLAERVIYNRISDENILRKTGALGSLNSLIRTQVLASVFQEFFGSNQLSQFMDQTNPLAEITHKRRLSSLGPGGLNRDRAGLIVRGIHPSYYGRICPIETPEGKNAGLTYRTSESQLEIRVNLLRTVQEINFLGLCPIQFMSIATSLIPFLEHDDANRALMGSNMQRQAVSLLRSERPFVGTGLEAHVTRDIGATIVAKQNSYISYVDAQRIDYFTPVIGDTNLIDYQNLTAEDRSNQDTCLNHKPLVEANTCVLVSERLVYDDVFTSIHIKGQEYFTNQVDRNQYLDEFGVVKIGTWVEAGDVLVGKISPQPDSDNDPESRLLRAIFGGVVRNTKTTSYCLSSGVSGRILDVRCEFKQKRRLQVGDKVAGRHGNKGIVSNILPRVDMPYLQSGKALDMVLNPLGVPSRMNVGQIFECLLEVSRGFVYHYLYKSRLLTQQKWLFKPNSPGKSIVFDGRTGLNFDQPVTVGYPYILKLVHLVDDKIHARSTGPYSLVTQQPLGGRSKKGGQRLGEMEVWALEGFGAAYVLQELLTIKSDDMIGRNRAFMSMIRGTLLPKSGIPESFKVLVSELRGLCLDMSIARINF